MRVTRDVEHCRRQTRRQTELIALPPPSYVQVVCSAQPNGENSEFGRREELSDVITTSVD